MDGTVATVVAATIGAIATIAAAWISRHRSDGATVNTRLVSRTPPTAPPSSLVTQQPKSAPVPRPVIITPTQARGEVVRLDGTREQCTSIGFNTWGNSFKFAFDENGVDKRELSADQVQRIDLLGPPHINDAEGRRLRNRWAPARITLKSGRELTDIFLDISGLGGWAWSYTADDWRGQIDEHVSAIIFSTDD
jgi:hypothetical protein